ncbi:MAG: hypothetical protein KJ044_14540, partial [Planctomycetes bacterium]|nr:hypothetical protein [Planctomycetota bacterium]
MKPPRLMPLLACAALVALAACRKGPDPRYEGPAGEGRLVYEPGRGIVRQGSTVAATEQALFARGEAAWRERNWAECIA